MVVGPPKFPAKRTPVGSAPPLPVAVYEPPAKLKVLMVWRFLVASDPIVEVLVIRPPVVEKLSEPKLLPVATDPPFWLKLTIGEPVNVTLFPATLNLPP